MIREQIERKMIALGCGNFVCGFKHSSLMKV